MGIPEILRALRAPETAATLLPDYFVEPQKTAAATLLPDYFVEPQKTAATITGIIY